MVGIHRGRGRLTGGLGPGSRMWASTCGLPGRGFAIPGFAITGFQIRDLQIRDLQIRDLQIRAHASVCMYPSRLGMGVYMRPGGGRRLEDAVRTPRVRISLADRTDPQRRHGHRSRLCSPVLIQPGSRRRSVIRFRLRDQSCGPVLWASPGTKCCEPSPRANPAGVRCWPHICARHSGRPVGQWTGRRLSRAASQPPPCAPASTTASVR